MREIETCIWICIIGPPENSIWHLFGFLAWPTFSAVVILVSLLMICTLHAAAPTVLLEEQLHILLEEMTGWNDVGNPEYTTLIMAKKLHSGIFSPCYSVTLWNHPAADVICSCCQVSGQQLTMDCRLFSFQSSEYLAGYPRLLTPNIKYCQHPSNFPPSF